LAIASGVTTAWPGTAASIPSGWSRVAALNDKYLKGTAAGVDPGGTGGALTHTHPVTSHGHTGGANHTHTEPTSGAAVGTSGTQSGTGVALANAGHTHISSGSTAGTASLTSEALTTDATGSEPAYYTVIWVQSDGTPAGIPNNGVTWWNTATPPTNWNHCDGGGAPARPDMRNRFLKGAATGADGGGTGGSATHTHAASHSHGGSVSHTHPTHASDVPSVTGVRPTGSTAFADDGHTHSLTIGSTAATVNAADIAAGTDNGEPPWYKLLPVQNNSGAADDPTGVICVWTGTLASIPSGWQLCDGTSGTPDLRSQFVKGANTTGEISNTGGAAGHSHTASSHTHGIASHVHTRTAATTTPTPSSPLSPAPPFLRAPPPPSTPTPPPTNPPPPSPPARKRPSLAIRAPRWYAPKHAHRRPLDP